MPDPNSVRSRLYNRGRAHGFQTGATTIAVTSSSQLTKMFTNAPWRDPRVPRLRAFHSDRSHKLPAEYKIELSH